MHAGVAPGTAISTCTCAAVPLAAVEGPLVEPQHVGDGPSPHAVESRQHVDEDARRGRAGSRPSATAGRARALSGATHEVVRPHRRPRHPRTPSTDAGDVARARSSAHSGHPSVRRGRSSASGCRGHDVVRIDLAVRVGDRGADLGAAVLEHQHVRDVVAARRAPPSGRPTGRRPCAAPSTPSDQNVASCSDV